MSDILRPSIITDFFPKDLMKKLYYNAWRSDIPDLNLKADIAAALLKKYEFSETGIGTNRIVFNKNGIVFKIAIDIPGFTDNLTELKRSGEKRYFPKVFECNYLICAQEYWTVMSEKQFIENQDGILEILKDLAEDYIFDDVGFQTKNYLNWGFREEMTLDDEETDGEIGILDFGYMYPKIGQEDALTCPICGGDLKYNRTFTRFTCQTNSCKRDFSPDDVVSRMDLTLDDFETQLFAKVSNVPEPIIRHTGKENQI